MGHIDQLKIIALQRVAEWIQQHDYRLPTPSSSDVEEIHVLCQLGNKTLVIDELVFNARNMRLKKIIFDREEWTCLLVKEIGFE